MADELKPLDKPRGLGLFIRNMAVSTIMQRVERMADAGITWAAIGTMWQDVDPVTGADTSRFINKPDVAKKISQALRSFGIDPWVWGYPWKGRHGDFVRGLQSASTDDTVGWVLDPEKGMKDKNPEVADHAARDLFRCCLESNPYRVIGFSSYGIPKGHPTFPWDSFIQAGGFNPFEECEFVSPQLYDEEVSDILRGMKQYQELGGDYLVPAFGTYKNVIVNGKRTTPNMTGAELSVHLQRFADIQAEFKIQAMIGWSEAQVSKSGWDVIEEFSGVFK